MKKIALLVIALFTSMVLSSYTINASLYNEELGNTLFLYQNGACTLTSPMGRFEGTYDIDGTFIAIHWNDGSNSHGSVTQNVGCATLDGVTYCRRVVRRR